jgi:TRAP-type C4-dicarboxylate transport system permease small subunit
MDYFNRIIGTITRSFDYLARLGMVALMVLVVANVILRYGFTSIGGTYDYVQLITALSVTSAVAYCAYERGHIEVEILMERVPERLQGIVGSIIGLFSVGFFALASWQCVKAGIDMKAMNETTMAIYIPLYHFMWYLAFGLAMTAIAIMPSWIGYISKAVKR